MTSNRGHTLSKRKKNKCQYACEVVIEVRKKYLCAEMFTCVPFIYSINNCKFSVARNCE